MYSNRMMLPPSEHVGSSAQGPIIATLLYLLKSIGRIPFWFSSSTIDSMAIIIFMFHIHEVVMFIQVPAWLFSFMWSSTIERVSLKT